jgi:hypothetical protein
VLRVGWWGRHPQTLPWLEDVAAATSTLQDNIPSCPYLAVSGFGLMGVDPHVSSVVKRMQNLWSIRRFSISSLPLQAAAVAWVTGKTSHQSHQDAGHVVGWGIKCSGLGSPVMLSHEGLNDSCHGVFVHTPCC